MRVFVPYRSASYYSCTCTQPLARYRYRVHGLLETHHSTIKSVHMATSEVENAMHAGPKRSRSPDSLRSESSTPIPGVAAIPLPSFLNQSAAGKLSNVHQAFKGQMILANRRIDINSRFEELQARQTFRLVQGQRASNGTSQYSPDPNTKIIRQRNRYMDIYPWAASRIRLKVPEGGCDYINASPISLCCSKTGREYRYIAAQVALTLCRLFQRADLEFRGQKHLASTTFGRWYGMKPRTRPSSSC